MDETRLPTLLAIWAITVLILFVARAKRHARGTGLVAAYVLSLLAIHAVAPLLYLREGYEYFNPKVVIAGLEVSTYAVAAFTFSSLFMTPFVLNFGWLPQATGHYAPDRQLPRAYLVLGIGSFVMLLLGLQAIPSATAVIGTGQQLFVVGLALCCWYAWKTKDLRGLAFWMGITGLLPFVTMTTMGYIGYGAFASLLILIFASSFVRSRPAVIAGALVVTYVGLSVYVTYMRDRSELREKVWSGQSYTDRISHVRNTYANFEWFDLTNDNHVSAVDERMNQSYLVGLSVVRLTDTGEYAHGETLWQALQALIPRILWPDKPFELGAGSGFLVTQFTGVEFGEGTSVGIGHVMEAYVNFGIPGVVVVFLLLGFLITTCDIAAADCLARNDLQGFVFWFLPGISLLNVGGAFVESTTSGAASIVVATLANAYLNRMRQRNRMAQARMQVPGSAVPERT